MPPGPDNLSLLHGRPPLLPGLVVVGQDGNEVHYGPAEQHLGWGGASITVWCVAVGQQGPPEGVLVQAAIGVTFSLINLLADFTPSSARWFE